MSDNIKNKAASLEILKEVKDKLEEQLSNVKDVTDSLPNTIDEYITNYFNKQNEYIPNINFTDKNTIFKELYVNADLTNVKSIKATYFSQYVNTSLIFDITFKDDSTLSVNNWNWCNEDKTLYTGIQYLHINGIDFVYIINPEAISTNEYLNLDVVSEKRNSEIIDKTFEEKTHYTNIFAINCLCEELYISKKYIDTLNAAQNVELQCESPSNNSKQRYLFRINLTYTDGTRDFLSLLTEEGGNTNLIKNATYQTKDNIFSKVYLVDNAENLYNIFFGSHKGINLHIDLNFDFSKSVEYYLDETDDYTVINDFSSYVKAQNYYDDMLRTKQGAMLRTDTLVLNQTNFGLSDLFKNPSNLGIKYLGDDSCFTRYRYFKWIDVQKEKDIYDFSVILDYVKSEYEKKHRVGLRLFPSCMTNTTDSVSYIVDEIEYHLFYPPYVADEIRKSGQWLMYNNKKMPLLDINLNFVYEEYKKLVEAFGTWFESASFINENDEEIHIKDLVMYIDIGLIGPWGEGGWYDLKWTSSVEDIVRYVKLFVDNIPNTQLNIGQWCTPGENERNQIYLKSRELYNNVGHVGMFLDNIGTNNPIYSYIVDREGRTYSQYLKAYAERGDFFTGEFAMWQQGSYWGYDQGLHTLKSFKLMKAPHFRMHNITDTFPNGENVNIEKVNPMIMQHITSALATVGSRYVMTPLKSYKTTEGVKICFTIDNIGLTIPHFDIFDLYYRVKDLDSDAFTDIPVETSLKDIKPNTEPLLYSVSNGTFFEKVISVGYTNYTVSIIGKDKLNLQSPMYFSNYNRNTDGSYLICSVIGNTVSLPSISEVMTFDEKIEFLSQKNMLLECDSKINEMYTNEYTPMLENNNTANNWKYVDNGVYYDLNDFRTNLNMYVYEHDIEQFDKVATFSNINYCTDKYCIVFLDENGNVIDGYKAKEQYEIVELIAPCRSKKVRVCRWNPSPKPIGEYINFGVNSAIQVYSHTPVSVDKNTLSNPTNALYIKDSATENTYALIVENGEIKISLQEN